MAGDVLIINPSIDLNENEAINKNMNTTLLDNLLPSELMDEIELNHDLFSYPEHLDNASFDCFSFLIRNKPEELAGDGITKDDIRHYLKEHFAL